MTKTLRLATLFVALLVTRVIAGLGMLPPIPVPKLTAAQAMAIAQAHLGPDSARYTLVGVDWHKSSDFQPRFAVAQYTPANDHPEEYSWFMTYVYRDNLVPGTEATQPFTAEHVIRIRDDGEIGAFIGII